MIPGLTYIDDFITTKVESDLIERIDAAAWLDDLKRRVQHYGYKYDYKARTVDESMFLGPLPDWAISLGAALVDRELFSVAPDQLIVKEYDPGQGISAHVDCEPCFKDTIASITLGSGCIMDFASVECGEKTIDLSPSSQCCRTCWRITV
ncbi:MAG: alpha-ketoglutarate-dependent dioxygenase AlkB [Planctomycetota bacterium]